MTIKSYFCGTCGRSYNYAEALRNGHKMYCYDCPTKQLHISGWPLMLIGVFIGLMYSVYNTCVPNANGSAYIFLPAAFGLFGIGLIRLFQEQYLRKHANQHLEDEDEDLEPAFQAESALPVVSPKSREAHVNTARPVPAEQQVS